jgi:UDP-N-acetyl-D-galactosamine dehydrogenase
MKRINKIGIIGMGYVGLPLAIEFGKYFDTVGFDIKKKRIIELLKKHDSNNEIKNKNFNKSKKLLFSFKSDSLKNCNFFIITVPTPVNKNKKPDLRYLIKATNLVAQNLKNNDVVVYESTVYPGLTDEICIPLLEKKSGISIFKKNNYNSKKHFYCGYSPERINPGDKKNDIKSIVKIVSGSCLFARKIIGEVYQKIIKNIYYAESIKVAEGAKIIENTQRDINIAFVNELSEIFEKLKIDFRQVLSAAKTKWNFLNFSPGLVGGHCIGVDPYYLAYKLKSVGYNPKLILQGRVINDNMGISFSKKLIKYLKLKQKKSKYNILILGASFKENVRDIRNSKVFQMLDYLCKNNNVKFYDPVIESASLHKKYKNLYLKKITKNYYDCVVLAVAHDCFLTQKFHKKINMISRKNTLIFDIKQKLNIKIINNKIISA